MNLNELTFTLELSPEQLKTLLTSYITEQMNIKDPVIEFDVGLEYEDISAVASYPKFKGVKVKGKMQPKVESVLQYPPGVRGITSNLTE